MSNQKLEYTSEELMSEDNFEEPLFGGEVRCHGGYIDGDYVSPRCKVRKPAIEAWRQRLIDDGQPLIHIPDAYVPPHYPNCEQAKYLLHEGIVDPISRSLTTISIVEGFGARIREVHLPDLGSEVKEDIAGTALAHLHKGLFEAHARDEAGYRDQGGHKQMWEAARDIGLNKPEIPNDVLLRMMSGGRSRKRQRLFPELSARMEDMITFLANILVIETFAEDVFAWAIDLLGDQEVSHDAELAAHLVKCVRADEQPHIDYLTLALSELRARTLVSEDGKKEFEGAQVIDHIFTRQLRGAATNRPRDARERLQKEIHELITDKSRAAKISNKFESLDSGWTFPKSENEQLDILLKVSECA
ncbi:MAG: hypothetical protein O6945_01200 [Gammaproteobacteria bacterium]|nr:hypothetical protein [Gammaproteobacteria bacterium]